MRSIKITSGMQDHRRACVPCALSTILNRPYNEVNAWLKFRGYRRNNNTGTFTQRMNMSELGLIKVSSITSTVNQFLNTPESKEGVFLIRTRGHCLAVKDGIAFDTINSEKRRIEERWKKIQDKLPLDWELALKVELDHEAEKQGELKSIEQKKKRKEYNKKLHKQLKEERKKPEYKLEQLKKRQKQWATKLKKAQTYLKKVERAIKRLEKKVIL